MESVRGRGKAKEIELLIRGDRSKGEKFDVIGVFIKDQDNHGGLSQFPSLKIRFEEAEFFKVGSREKDGKCKGFEGRKGSGEQNVKMIIVKNSFSSKLIQSIKLLQLT